MNKEILWSRSNLKEVISELPYPITQSDFVINNKSFFLNQYKRMGYFLLPEDTEFTKTFYGRQYFNMNITYKILSDYGHESNLEGYKMAFGGFHSASIHTDKLSFTDRIKMIYTFIKTFYDVINIDKITGNSFKTINDRYRADFNKDLKSLTDKEIIDYFDLIDELIKNDKSLIIGGSMNFNYWKLGEMLKGFEDIEKPDDVLNQLVTGTSNIISANQNFELIHLAGYVKDNGLEFLLEKNYDEITDTTFKQILDEFIYKFGHRGIHELCIESPRFYENPEAILKIIKSYITAGMVSPEDIISRQKKIREDAIENIMKSKVSYFKKILFKKFLNDYTHLMSLREENKYHLVMTGALSRRHILEIGRRFAEREVIDEQSDIYFLTIPEIKKRLSGEIFDCKKLVEERKVERERNSKYIVPDFFIGEFKPETVKEKSKELKQVFTGYAASSGIVQGRARIIHSPEEFGRFKAGEILVAPTTDPMWTNLFPIAKAVVAEMGGVLSHASIVAREYGTPCVVNVEGIVDALKDGDLIEVDGTTGLVRLLTKVNVE